MARVVVVGGGLGGTAAAARLAKLGHQVTLAERLDRLGGAVGFYEQDGYRWDTGPTSTALPAVLRDLFRKTGRQLDRELELVPVQPLREHRFQDGTCLALPAGSRAAQQSAIDGALGSGLGQQWLDYTYSFVDSWNALRRSYLERPYSPGHAEPDSVRLLRSRATLSRTVKRALHDERLRQVALTSAVLEGHDPRKVPAWLGMMSYVEQNFGRWTVPGGMGLLAGALTKRLAERRVEVLLGTTVRDLVARDGRVVGVTTDAGMLDADVVVCAVDPARIPALAGVVRRTPAALPPAVTLLGLVGEVPSLPHEVVLHGDPMVVVRPGGPAHSAEETAQRSGENSRDTSAGQARTPWSILTRGHQSEDVVSLLAERGIDVRSNIAVRLDRSPQDLVKTWGGSPYGLLWQGRRTTDRRPGTSTPLAGVFCCGANAVPGAGVPFVGLGAALVAQVVGPP
jgi:phytoene dehydrogenase-like protein